LCDDCCAGLTKRATQSSEGCASIWGNQPCHSHSQAGQLAGISGSVFISISPHIGQGRIQTPDWVFMSANIILEEPSSDLCAPARSCNFQCRRLGHAITFRIDLFHNGGVFFKARTALRFLLPVRAQSISSSNLTNASQLHASSYCESRRVLLLCPDHIDRSGKVPWNCLVPAPGTSKVVMVPSAARAAALPACGLRAVRSCSATVQKRMVMRRFTRLTTLVGASACCFGVNTDLGNYRGVLDKWRLR
jgi:hypothetical protein